jgi:HPt (histidine-containing phosphotransfer) domain-containing protein
MPVSHEVDENAGNVPGKQTIIDQTALNEIRALQRDGAQSFLNKVIRHYFDDSPRHLGAMRLALAGDAPDELWQAAHSFKSSSAFLGADTLAELCHKMEVAGRDHATAGAVELMARIESEYAATYRLLAVILEGECHGE